MNEKKREEDENLIKLNDIENDINSKKKKNYIKYII